MSRSDRQEWQEAQDKLRLEKKELAMEGERQKMLDELSFATRRNNDLENAMARLAREQDRLLLAEQERIFKRAQIAQATAALVHEANWAKNRMENEMKLAKQRSQLFPETVIPGSLGVPATRGTVPDVRPLKLLREHQPEELVAAEKPIATNSEILSKPSTTSTPTSMADFPSTIQSAFSNVVGTIFATDEVDHPNTVDVDGQKLANPKTEPLVATSIENKEIQPSAAQESIAIDDDKPEKNDHVIAPAAPAPKDPDVVVREHDKSAAIDKGVNSVNIPAPVLVNQTVKSVKGISFRPPPVKTAHPQIVRAVHRGGKGEWISQEIYDEAAQRMEAQARERADMLQYQRTLMTQLFGLAEPVSPTLIPPKQDPLLDKLESEWREQIKKEGLKYERREPLPEINPVVEAALTDEPHQEHVEAEPPDGEASAETRKKKGCIVM